LTFKHKHTFSVGVVQMPVTNMKLAGLLVISISAALVGLVTEAKQISTSPYFVWGDSERGGFASLGEYMSYINAKQTEQFDYCMARGQAALATGGGYDCTRYTMTGTTPSASAVFYNGIASYQSHNGTRYYIGQTNS
jgi:hypothetical protein